MKELEIIEKELAIFIKELQTSISDKSEIKNILKGWKIFYSPIKTADILFIGINPGAGELNDPFFFDSEPHNIIHYLDTDNNNYSLARNTTALFKEMDLLSLLGRESVKVNSKFYATKDLTSMFKFEQLLCSEHPDLYEKLIRLNKDWLTRIIQCINPKIIICEGIKSLTYLDEEIYKEEKGWKYYLKYEENKICGYFEREDGLILFGYSRSPKYFNIEYISIRLKPLLLQKRKQ